MGASTFISTGEGATAKAAFRDAVEKAAYDYGHRGYTGSLAEKDSFVMIDSNNHSLMEANELAEKLIDEGDERIDDKWGPAGCIKINDNSYLFFGWASS